jgi:hypothetical protein
LPFLFSRITEAIEDLLRIVKVAMPEDLFENDPRVIKAESVVAQLQGEIQLETPMRALRPAPCCLGALMICYEKQLNLRPPGTLMMRRLAVLATLIAFSSFALASSAPAQDEGGGAAGGGVATTPDTPTPGPSSTSTDATAPSDATPAVAACAAGSTSVGGAPCSAPAPAQDPGPAEDPYGMHDSGQPSPGAMEVLRTGNGQTRV